MSDERAERIARNEATFRSVNDQIRRINSERRVIIETYVCECADAACDATIQLTSGEYQRVRSSPYRFAVVTGHVVPDMEAVVERHPSYDVVEKSHPHGRAIAEATDPRS